MKPSSRHLNSQLCAIEKGRMSNVPCPFFTRHQTSVMNDIHQLLLSLALLTQLMIHFGLHHRRHWEGELPSQHQGETCVPQVWGIFESWRCWRLHELLPSPRPVMQPSMFGWFLFNMPWGCHRHMQHTLHCSANTKLKLLADIAYVVARSC